MKLVTYADTDGNTYPGVIRGDEVVRLDAPDMRSLFESGDLDRSEEHTSELQSH